MADQQSIASAAAAAAVASAALQYPNGNVDRRSPNIHPPEQQTRPPYNPAASFGESMAQLSLGRQHAEDTTASMFQMPPMSGSGMNTSPQRATSSAVPGVLSSSNGVIDKQKHNDSGNNLPIQSVSSTASSSATSSAPQAGKKESTSRHENRHMWTVDETDALVAGCTKVCEQCPSLILFDSHRR